MKLDCKQVLYRYRQRKTALLGHTRWNLIDYWNAIHERYENLGKIEGYEQELRRQCALAISRTWRWFYSVPQEERNYNHLSELYSFSVQNYRLFGEQGWPLTLRVCIFFAHSKRPISLWCCNMLNSLLWDLKFGNALWE